MAKWAKRITLLVRKGIKAALYADYMLLLCTEENATTATYRMQQDVNNLATLAKDKNFSINKELHTD